MNLSTDSKTRKSQPIATGVLDYFPLALAAVAECSKAGNDQHNPGEPLHWAREKSSDHADCVVRHLIDRGTLDKDGIRHSTKVAWRALALLQLEIEADASARANVFIPEPATRADIAPPAFKDCQCMQCEAIRQNDAECKSPPVGWRCTREAGHEGPCAAYPAPQVLT